jgi:hypothetical protein
MSLAHPAGLFLLDRLGRRGHRLGAPGKKLPPK